LSVSTNMVMASLGEETRASCRGPSNHNAVALILPHKAMLGPTSRVGRLMALEKARKCWVSAPAFEVVVLNDVEVRRALS
jgi:hypothetical protein